MGRGLSPVFKGILSTAPIFGVSFFSLKCSSHSIKDMTSMSDKHTNEALWLLATFHSVAED